MGGGNRHPSFSPSKDLTPTLPPTSSPSTAALQPVQPRGLNVLVTGFGPFPLPWGEYGVNTSHLVTTLLPSTLPPHTTHNPTPTPITIHTPTARYNRWVKVQYTYVRNFVQLLFNEHGDDIDLVLHLGMADGWDHYTVERGASKQGSKSTRFGTYYMIPDDAGMVVSPPCPWPERVPGRLETEVDVDRVVERMMKLLNDSTENEGKDGRDGTKQVKVVPHDDAGEYCCGFIYYESLATCRVRGLKTKVVFCHVPGESDRQTLETGRDVVLALIRAFAEGKEAADVQP